MLETKPQLTGSPFGDMLGMRAFLRTAPSEETEMRSSWWIVAATLAAGTSLLAQNPGNGNGKANGRGGRLVGQAGPNGSGGAGIVPLNYDGGPVMARPTFICI